MKRALFEFIYVAGPKFSSGALALGLNVVLMRFFAPDQFGVYSLCVTAILLAEAIIGSPFDMAIVRLCTSQRDSMSEQTLSFERSALIIKLFLALGLTVLLVLAAESLNHRVFQNLGSPQLILYSCLAIFAMLLVRSSQVHLQIRRQFPLYGLVDLIQMAIKFGGIALVLIFLEPTLESVLIFFLLAPGIAFIVSQFTVSRELNTAWRTNRNSTRTLLDLVKWFFATCALGALINRLDVFSLATLSTISEVGIYSGGFVFAMIPEMLGAYLAVVVSPRIMPYCKSGRFLRFFVRTQRLLILAAVVAYFILWLAWDFIGLFLLPESYLKSAEIIFILLPGTLVTMATFPLAMPFVMFVKRRFLFIMDCISLPVLCALLYFIVPEFGGVGAAWVTCGSLAIRGIIVQISAWNWARMERIPFDIEAVHEKGCCG